MTFVRGAALPFWCLVLGACATIGSDGLGDVGLPSAGVGPFRRLTSDEVPGIAPFVLDGDGGYREAAVLSDNPETTEVVLYAGATGQGRDGIPVGPVIVRSLAKDGRSFVGTGNGPGRGTQLALAASEPWEAGGVHSPFALRVDAQILLFYAGSQGGIGVARASAVEGPYTKDPAPVLDAKDAAREEGGAPRAPSVYLEGDTLHLFYATPAGLFEAVSPRSPLAFRRVDANPSTSALDPVLTRAPDVDPKSLGPGEKPPFDERAVGDPCVALRTTPAGRPHVRVLYTGTSLAGTTAIGFAARYGHEGPLVRQVIPIYAAKGKERAPALLDLGAKGYLYVTEPRTDGRDGVGGSFFPASGDPGPLVPAE